MSYLVLARKYRPRNFTEMVGQQHVVQALTNALTQQRLHHAYLFTGTRGVGKTTVSRILAKSLNCQGPDGQGGITATPCGVCPACTDIDSGRFPDYTELDAASNRGVDEVQGLLEQAVYKPVQGRFKVFMIDEVHMLTNTAFNAMLKTLEEPPEYLKFVLATTDPQKVPVTVLSRCLQFNLRPMAPETVLEHLAQVLATEQVPAEPQALRLLARAARGSMRDALSLTDQAIAFGSGRIEEATVRQMLGSVDCSHVLHLIDALAQADGRSVVHTVETLRQNGLSAASTLEEMVTVLQRMAVLQAVPGMDAGAASDPEAAEVQRLAALLPADETQLLYSICLHGRAELGLAPDEYAALTMVLLRLLPFKATSGTAEKKTLKPAEAPPAAAAAPAAPAPAGPAPHAAPAALQPEPKEAAAPVVQAQPAIESIAEQTPAPAPEAPFMPAAVADAQPAPAEPAQAAAGEPEAEPARQAASARLRALPVRSPEAAAPVPQAPAAAAPKVAPIPVREPRQEGARLQPRPAEGAAARRLVPTAEGEAWQAAVQQLIASEAITALVRELALQSQLVARDGEHWLLRVESESLNQGSTRERLRAALAAAGLAQQISVELGPVTDSPALRNAARQNERQQRALEIVQNDPFVQTLVREFDARIVPGSVQPL
ncbi:DNA polymerase III subunit gamma/tau [Comamonas granuli]|uniref:DNA polymerase III subunit gamma/tau n=1 Tax=Comamonas granuli TaxID=290309 RepID=UPI0005A996B1|nr:DNA polymerase III subunit gamma/tau [Comamonas granuli]